MAAPGTWANAVKLAPTGDSRINNVPNVRIKGWVRVYMQTFDRVGVLGPTFAIGCLTGTASLQIEENSELNQIRLKNLAR
jgi:hypothetical protein